MIDTVQTQVLHCPYCGQSDPLTTLKPCYVCEQIRVVHRKTDPDKTPPMGFPLHHDDYTDMQHNPSWDISNRETD